MSEHELENMIVRLTGNGSSFTKMNEDAVRSAESAGAAVEAQTKRVEGFAGGLRTFASVALSSLAAIGAKNLLSGFQEAFEGREEGIIRLNAVLQANGRSVESTTASYKSFAADLSNVTTLSQGATLGLLRQAETFGITGDEAKNAVRDAAAFEAITGNAAEAMIRLTAAMAKGDVGAAQRFARMVPQLRGIKDQSEFVAKYQTLVNAGLATAGELANTTGGQMKKLDQAMTGLKADLGGTVAEGILPFVQTGRQFIGVLRNLSPETKRWAVAILSATAAVLAAGPAWAILKVALAPLLALLQFLILDLIIGVPLWIAWTAGTAAYTVVTLALQAAVWLLNAALTATNVVMALIYAIGFIIFVQALIAAVVVLSAALMAVWETGRALYDVFNNLISGGALSNFSAIGGIFKEWGQILKEVLDTAKTNMPLAWELLQAGGKLAVAQLQGLWQPLWDFIKTGFVKIANFVAFAFKDAFFVALAEMGLKLEELSGTATDADRDLVAKIRVVHQNEMARRQQQLGRQLGIAAGKFGAAVGGIQDSDAVKAARAGVDEVRDKIAEAGEAEKDNQPAFQGMADSAEKAAKSAEKFDAAIVGSAEATTRIENYLDLLAGGMAPTKGGPGNAVMPAGGLGEGEDPADILADMRDIMQKEQREGKLSLEISSIT